MTLIKETLLLKYADSRATLAQLKIANTGPRQVAESQTSRMPDLWRIAHDRSIFPVFAPVWMASL
jgi:hypothetical protein